ncbi:hypothetical protein CUR178_04796 [Leishmania enriettii]|uniref:Uncharacterized protein n=1 Tax=Leishmania enriettii TaxID=5663 RepID=A0A836KRS5_LEIEN|nr:hypothetical protein CUR178_04796 [Leishmania enriettii]
MGTGLPPRSGKDATTSGSGVGERDMGCGRLPWGECWPSVQRTGAGLECCTRDAVLHSSVVCPGRMRGRGTASGGAPWPEIAKSCRRT